MDSPKEFLRKSFDRLPEFPHSPKSLISKSRLIRIATITAISLVLLFFLKHLPGQDAALLQSKVVSPITSKPGYVHLLIPASHPDQNLCKVILSAGILGYPPATLVNWNKEFNDPNLVEGGSHLAKISGMKDYLEGLDSSRNSDVVLMVDGYDIWFQLRPQTLIDRYFDQNRRANERVREELGADVVDRYNISQQIIFSCQKRCWPWSEKDPPCYAVPESSLPKDIYGPQTDTDIGDEQNPYIKYRQRFLNSGVAIGTVEAMRKLFKEAFARAEQDGNFGSDQNIFSGLFGEQEVLRELRRQESMNGARRVMGGLVDGRQRKFKKEHLDMVRDRDVEFGLGVDYESSIGLATVFAEDDTEWLTSDDKMQVAAANVARGIVVGQSRIDQVQQDIADTLPPFWTFEHRDLPRDTKWSQIPLFTDVWTGVAPAIIHHNAHRDGLKSLRESWWDKIWFQRYARELYNDHITHPLGAIAVSGGKEWWSAEDWKGGARHSGNDWIRYEEMCTGTEDEVFRDGKGPWYLPDDH